MDTDEAEIWYNKGGMAETFTHYVPVVWVILLGICCTTAGAEPNDANGVVDTSVIYQEIEGFGASGSHYENWLVAHPLKNEIYDIIFRQLGLDIYRIRNTYDMNAAYIDATADIIDAANASLARPLKIMLTSGSPPAYLKSNNSTSGGTLARYPEGGFQYAEFADWWADGLADYANHGIDVEYISIQNEPDWLDVWETCKMIPEEDDDWAGYNLAFEAVYQELASRLTELPKMLAPETMGFGGSQAFINTLIDPNHVYGYAHHLYSDGEYYDPDAFIPGMQNYAQQYGDKPLLQTECSGNNDESNFNGAMTLARHIHNSLVHEGVCSYLYWDLFWGDAGGLVAIEFPWQSDPGYKINSTYYAFKHYSAFTDPGWHRIEASTDSDDVRISAFISPDANDVSVVIINASEESINLSLSVPNFTHGESGVFRTSRTEKTAYLGPFDSSGSLPLPAESITTVWLTDTFGLTACDDVQSNGFALTADMNGDCHINNSDLLLLAEYWLINDCGPFDDCRLADLEPDGAIDLSDLAVLAEQWLTGNSPADLN